MEPQPGFPTYGLGTPLFDRGEGRYSAADQIADFDLYESILDDAQSEGVVSEPPQSEVESRRPGPHVIRNRTNAKRLWLLGYLEREVDDDDDSDRLVTVEERQAVERFQHDAGLVEDGWIGEKTWRALDSLVGFESELEIEGWYDGDEPSLVLQRAAQLRLFCLGLTDRRPDPDFDGLEAGALRNLRRILRILGVARKAELAGRPRFLFERLFDQDGLVEALAGASSNSYGETFSLTSQAGMKRRPAERLLRRFATNAARVELWLLGFEVTLDGKDDYPCSGCATLPPARRDPELKGLLGRYWRDFVGQSRATFLARAVRPRFFASLIEGSEVERSGLAPLAEEDYSLTLAEDLKTPSAIETAWTQVKRLGASLWDGMKRLWRWIKRGVAAVVRIAKNVARGFFRYALKAYRIVRAGVRAVVDSVRYLTHAWVPGSSPEDVAVAHDGDFDFAILLNPKADRSKVDTMSRRLVFSALSLETATRILSLAWRTFRDVAMGGWARLLLGLVRSLGELKQLYQGLRRLMRLRPEVMGEGASA